MSVVTRPVSVTPNAANSLFQRSHGPLRAELLDEKIGKELDAIITV